MKKVNVQEAKTHFYELIDAVFRGDEILIFRAGKPVAKLTPIHTKPKIKFGVFKGKIKIAEDFDSPLPKDYSELVQLVE